MPTNSGPDWYTIFIGVIMALVGLLNAIGMFILKGLKNTDGIIFGRLNDTDRRVNNNDARLEGVERDIEWLKKVR